MSSKYLILIFMLICTVVSGIYSFSLGCQITENEYQMKEYIKTGKLMLVADWTLDRTKKLYDLNGDVVANVTFKGNIALTEICVTSGDMFVIVFNWGKYHKKWITIEVPKVKLHAIEDEYIITRFEVL